VIELCLSCQHQARRGGARCGGTEAGGAAAAAGGAAERTGAAGGGGCQGLRPPVCGLWRRPGGAGGLRSECVYPLLQGAFSVCLAMSGGGCEALTPAQPVRLPYPLPTPFACPICNISCQQHAACGMLVRNRGSLLASCCTPQAQAMAQSCTDGLILSKLSMF